MSSKWSHCTAAIPTGGIKLSEAEVLAYLSKGRILGKEL